MMFSLLYTFCLHFYLINIHIFDYPDSRLSGRFTEVPTSPDNRGSTVPCFSSQCTLQTDCCDSPRLTEGNTEASGLWMHSQQMKSKVMEFHSLSDINVECSKRSIIGYLENKDSDSYKNFEKVAEEFRDDCHFHVGVGDASLKERQTGENIVFRPQNRGPDMVYMGDLGNYDLFKTWVSDKCIPLVTEITFENAEELTEEGLPFLLLFYHPEDTASIEIFKSEVAKQFIQEKGSVNFLIADGLKFSHPLHHLGKGPEDVQALVAIDSFKHVYLPPKFDDIKTPGKLSKFVQDLHSGKLHREFHHGPDPKQEPQQVDHTTDQTDDNTGTENNQGTETEAETGKTGRTGSGSGKKKQT